MLNEFMILKCKHNLNNARISEEIGNITAICYIVLKLQAYRLHK